MSDFRELVQVRDGVESDKNFILATFLRGLYYGDSWFSIIPKNVFMDNYKVIAEILVQKGNIKVACLPEDPDVIIGYSILSPDFQGIHWVYVKSAWRKKGIAKALLPQYPLYVTHLSKLGYQLLPKFKDAIFNPFKL